MTTLSVVLNWVLTPSWTRGDSANPPTRNRWDTLQTRSLAHFLFARTTFWNNFVRHVTVVRLKIKIKKEGGIFSEIFCDIQHCIICRPSVSTVSEDAGIEPRTVATTSLAVKQNKDIQRKSCLPMSGSANTAEMC